MSISRNLLFLILTVISNLCFSQVIPDAGTLERDVKQQHDAQKQPREIQPLVAPESDRLSGGKEGAKVFVHAFKFEGNTLFSNEQLERALAPYLDRELNFNQINAAAHRTAAYYRESGRLARTGLPKQDVTDGVITIRVIEANFSGVRMSDKPTTTRIDPNQILAIIKAGSPVNQPLNIHDLERSLLIADDMPGVNASGALRAGTRPAETELQLSLSDEALLIGEVGINNHGNRATGSERLWVNLNLNSPAKKGDLLNSTLVRSRGSDYVQLSYSLPLFLPGLRLGGSAAYMDYELISSELKPLNAKGDFSSFGLNANYPLIRSSKKNLYLSLDFTRKKYSYEALSTTQSGYAVNVLSRRLTGDLRDEIAGGGINTASVAWTTGDVQLAGLEAGEDAELEGSFNKLVLGVNRLQFIANEIDLLASMKTQFAGEHLDSSERFYLGGENDVRAYPSSEASGSSGWSASVELRRRMLGHFLLSGFYDMGRVYNKNSSPDYGLKGIGIKASWHNDKGLKVEGTWSHRVGSNPNSTTTGNDQDGSRKKNRLWLSLLWAFDGMRSSTL